jgi:hypothetical protein
VSCGWGKTGDFGMAFEENEMVMLFLGIGVLIFILLRRKQLKQLPGAHLLITSFSILLVGWLATVLEGLLEADSFSQQLFNYLEHFCDAGSGLMMAWWSWRTFTLSKEA